MNILIVKLSAIGDVIHTLPALNALRGHFPKAHIAWLVEEEAAALVVGHEALDRVLISRRKGWLKALGTAQGLKSLREMHRFIRQLRDTTYDVILDFQGLLKSGILIGLAKGKRKIGFDRGMEHAEESHVFLNERVSPVNMEIHALTRSMMLLEASLGIVPEQIVFRLPISLKHKEAAKGLLSDEQDPAHGPLVVVHPVAKWETKLWENLKFSRLCDALVRRYDARIVFTGQRRDRRTINDIRSGMCEAGLDLSGKTPLMVLAALFETADCVISTDTGPMHLAAAVGTPVVALFGPTAPWRTGPFGPGHEVVRADLECSPCFKRRCQTVECMAQISVEKALNGVQKVLNAAVSPNVE
ncbi:MAG: lipopolysaccharide heptosyltransferase I [Deltaproteobacteria bacterium]|nr:lipopolysaccharide heptosyltransferase I [Deltaproteobacteria bacterium]